MTAPVERELRVETGDGHMWVFIVRPGGPGPFPVALVYMDAYGYREAIKGNVRRFAAAGYCCVMPDLFHRTGDRRTLDPARSGQEDLIAELRALVASVTPAMVADDTRDALAAVAGDPAAGGGPAVCVGYCMGARMALHVAGAMPERIAAAAGIHPGSLVTDAATSPHHDLDGVRGEIYVAFAEHDRSATAASVARFDGERRARGVAGEVERIAGARHGFALPDLPVFEPAAADHVAERTLALWRRAVPPGQAADSSG
ncbi:MAG: dienelactone hydrolase family protein [Thermoleophilia bacterium]|nr:dienelactone hydrolase family protein [Thermoleophilia bacterium]